MNSVIVVILGFIVAFIEYRVYAKYVDEKIMQADPKRVTPAWTDNWPYHRYSMGMASCVDMDPSGNLLYRLGSGLFNRYDFDEKRWCIPGRFKP
jgi:hypothetical protein